MRKILARRELAVLGLLAILGGINLHYPLRGDQALFLLAAEKLHHGAVLYRDFWDIKQPGIYLYYLIAGSLFGFSEFGIHLFTLLYLVAFATILQLTLRSYFRDRWSRALLPLVAIGPYLATATPWIMEQVEDLIGVPLFMALWLCLAASRRDGLRRWILLFLSGVAGAAVVLFKLIYLPVVAAIWVSFLWLRWSDWGRRGSAERWKSVAAVALGLVLPLGILWIVYAPVIGGRLLYEVSIVDPVRIARDLPPQKLSTLLLATRWFVDNFLGLTVLAAIGAATDLRRRTHPVTVALLGWIASGVVIFLLQRTSWWAYQLVLVTVPIGILAMLGIESIVRGFGGSPSSFQGSLRRHATVLLILLLAFGVPAMLGAKKLYHLARANFTIGSGKLQAYQFALDPEYREAWHETAFLRSRSSRPGDIYIMGDPTYYLSAGRTQAIPLNGWMLELFVPAKWRGLRSELAAYRPPYLFISSDNLLLMSTRSQDTMAFVEKRYNRISADAHGTWFELRPRTTLVHSPGAAP